MTPEYLIEDLRSRIDSRYAKRIGTESWERKRCADALESLVRDRDRMREALELWLDAYDSPESWMECRHLAKAAVGRLTE
jgi:hypothetical protein